MSKDKDLAENYNWKEDLCRSRYVDVEYTERGKKAWYLGIIENVLEIDLSIHIRYDGWDESHSTVKVYFNVDITY